MREILFRGKRKDNGEWIEGGVVIVDNDSVTSGGKQYIIAPHEQEFYRGELGYFDFVIPETIGQYTGLTDKNGKKIFEGDIFRMEDDMIAVIIFNDGCFRLQVYGLSGTFTESGYDEDGGGYGVIECEPIDWYHIHDMQVIGNIHDNPELLKGGE